MSVVTEELCLAFRMNSGYDESRKGKLLRHGLDGHILRAR